MVVLYVSYVGGILVGHVGRIGGIPTLPFSQSWLGMCVQLTRAREKKEEKKGPSPLYGV